VDVVVKDKPYLLDGRNLDSTWFRIMISANRGCWVAASAGSPSGDVSGLRVLNAPTNTPTPLPKPTDTPIPTNTRVT
jgi:hypothetical protein